VATTPFASMTSLGRTPSSTTRRRWLALGLALGLIALAVVACGTAAAANPTVSPAVSPAASAAASGASPAVSATPSPSNTPAPLTAATIDPNPISVLAWAFTPIFQALFLLLAALYMVTGNVVVAIILMTLIIRLVTMRQSAKSIVSQQRLQRLQPELRALNKELQRRYKGDRQAVYQAQQQFYKDRGVSPTSGCLPTIIQMGMLIPMYSVIGVGLTNFNPSAMLSVFGQKVVPLTCPNPEHIVNGVLDKSQPCIDTVVAGVNMGKPQILFDLPLGVITIGVSALALVSAFLIFIQSRMTMPPAVENDPSAQTTRTMMIMMPLFSIFYGGIIPAGLFVYWIVSSLFSIVQQFLFVGWGSIFPLFGWTPAFARNYTPRFPVTMPTVTATSKSPTPSRPQSEDRWMSAASTVRPNTRRRATRRGRRR
jgi:YidC/Oxa1 family membrane protein insertase